MLNLTNNLFKLFKKSAVISLCTVMTIVAIPGINSFAAELDTNNNDTITNKENDIYSEKFEETVSIEGISYTYKYFYNENGDKSISILNNKTSTVETVTYDDESSNIYLDGKKIADVQTVDDDTDGSVITRSKRSTKGGFKSLGTRHKKITWIKAMTTAAIAGVIATVMGGVGGILILGKSAVVGLIIGSCGGVTLATIASGSAGGELHWTAWKKATRYIDHFKVDWSFIAPTDERYGTYHYYYSVK